MLPHPTVLVADDDRLLRESLCDALTSLGCEARPACGGGEAIQVLARGRCDLLVSDVDMPDMTGFELLAWVHQHQPMPAVLMSARADSELRRIARSAGAIDLLTKPVGIALLASIFQFLPDRRL